MAAVEGRVVGAERVVSVKRVTTWSHHHSRCHAHLHALDSRTSRAARPPATWTTATPAARSLIVPSELGLIRSPSWPRPCLLRVGGASPGDTRSHCVVSASGGLTLAHNERRTTRHLHEGRNARHSPTGRGRRHLPPMPELPPHPEDCPAPREVVLVCVSISLRGGGRRRRRGGGERDDGEQRPG